MFKKLRLLFIVLLIASSTTGCATMAVRLAERAFVPTMKKMPIHDVFYISPATQVGDTVMRWYPPRNSEPESGSWMIVEDIKDGVYHLVVLPGDDGMLLHRMHYWIKDNHVLRAELEYRGTRTPMRVEPAKEGGMFTNFEAIDLEIPQIVNVRGKDVTIHRIETLDTDAEFSAFGVKRRTQYKSIRYISNDVPLGVVKDDTYFSSQVLQDNWEYVRIGLKALDPNQPKADTLLKLVSSFKEKEKVNFQITFYQEKRKMQQF